MEKPKIIFDISSALFSLVPNAIWGVRDGVLEWNDSEVTRPSDAEIDAEIIRLQAEYDSQEYARKRAEAYPSLSDQMDMIMKDNRDGTKTHQTACEAVKKKYPKG